MTLWRNWIARWTSNPTVAGSNPVSVVIYLLLYFKWSLWRNWITRCPHKVKIAGSNTVRDIM